MTPSEAVNTANFNEIQAHISEECRALETLLLTKNRDYGNSALDPVRSFSQANPVEQLNVRIDDKLSRIRNQQKKTHPEDTEQDLLGYLILKRIAMRTQHTATKAATPPPFFYATTLHAALTAAFDAETVERILSVIASHAPRIQIGDVLTHNVLGEIRVVSSFEETFADGSVTRIYTVERMRPDIDPFNVPYYKTWNFTEAQLSVTPIEAEHPLQDGDDAVVVARNYDGVAREKIAGRG